MKLHVGFFTCNSTYNLTNRRCLGSDERPFERDWVHDVFDLGLFTGQAVIEPVGESRSDFYIFRDLCRKMGNPDLWPWETERELCDWKLEPLGITEGNWVWIETKHGFDFV